MTYTLWSLHTSTHSPFISARLCSVPSHDWVYVSTHLSALTAVDVFLAWCAAAFCLQGLICRTACCAMLWQSAHLQLQHACNVQLKVRHHQMIQLAYCKSQTLQVACNCNALCHTAESTIMSQYRIPASAQCTKTTDMLFVVFVTCINAAP